MGVNNGLFHKVSYIYVVEATQTTIKIPTDATCGDANGDTLLNTALDCQILAMEIASKVINTVGNVDQVSLIQAGFGEPEVDYRLRLDTPWVHGLPQYRDQFLLHKIRTAGTRSMTTYWGGAKLACDAARSSQKEHKVVIFLSNTAPYHGYSSKDTIMNNCDGAIFHVSCHVFPRPTPFHNYLNYLFSADFCSY